MAKLRSARAADEIDRHHIHVSFRTADDHSPDAGARFANVLIGDEVRKTKGDDYRPYAKKLDARLLNMKLDDALDELAIEALADAEARAAEIAASKGA